VIAYTADQARAAIRRASDGTGSALDARILLDLFRRRRAEPPPAAPVVLDLVPVSVVDEPLLRP
jgi:hypothetical protein